MWKTCANTSIVLLLSSLAASGQGSYTPSHSQYSPAPAPATAAASAPTGGMFESNTFQQMANSVFDPSSDSMDFQEGSYQWKGRTFNLTNQRAFRARFERFLLDSPSADAVQYAALMAEIMNRLSVGTDSSDDTILEAWQLLFQASEFEEDGGNSTIVANQVFNAWRIYKETRGTALSYKELEDIRRNQQEVVANRDRMLRRLQEQRDSGGTHRESKDKPSESSSEMPTEAAFRALDLAETEAKIVQLEAQNAATGIQAKLQFQSQIVTFVMQRRFQHALVLASFYQQLFKGSQQKLEVGTEELKSFLPNTDLTFTVDTLSFMSREALNDVRNGVDAVQAAYEEGRRLLALERVQETFFLGEHLSDLDRISVEQRRTFLDIYRAMLEAQELADAKDYKGVGVAVTELAAMADDFPSKRVLASIETAMSMSDMAVFAASQYRNRGLIDQARDELRNAVEIWPSNPSIREFQSETTRLATANSQGEQIFDDLYAREDRRGIYERRMELGFALAEDPERKPMLLDIVDQVAQMDLLIAQAKELTKQGESFAAWELLESARAIDSDDAPMNRARAELAPRVARFIGYVDRGDQYAKSANYASALTAYLVAQDIYPASRTCRIGIKQMSQALMASLLAQED